MANKHIFEVGQVMLTEAVAWENAEIMQGHVFEVTHEFTGLATSGGTGEILIRPNGENIGIAVITCKSTQEDADAKAFEGPTFGEGDEGTELSAFCTNRKKNNDPTTVLTHTPTVSDNGDELPSYSLDLLARYVLDGGQNYLLQFINNNSSNQADIAVKIMWNERDT